MTSFIRKIFGDIFSSFPPFGNSAPLTSDSLFVFGEFSCFSQKEQDIRSCQQKKADRNEVKEDNFASLRERARKSK